MDLDHATREELLELARQQQQTIARLEAVIERLEARIVELENRLGRGGKGMPGLKPKSKDAGPKPARTPRVSGYGRERGTPTMMVSHAVERCDCCDIALVGGSVKRTREVIELSPSLVQLIQHVYLERRCPLCGKRWVPKAELAEQVIGKGRLGIELLGLIATLR